MTVKENLRNIKQTIEEACQKVNRHPEEIKIIAVTKYVSNERAKEVLEAGVVDLGENRDDGFLEKKIVLEQDKPVWHFIGTLQSRKVKNIINEIDYLHSLDRLSLAKEIDKRAEKTINCFVQVNASGEQSKYGLHPDEVKSFILQLKSYERIHVVGLMTMAPFTDDETVIRSCFQKVKEIQQEIQQLHLDYAPCHELSMGMSNDFHIAIEEGATMIRIGTALVGKEN